MKKTRRKSRKRMTFDQLIQRDSSSSNLILEDLNFRDLIEDEKIKEYFSRFEQTRKIQILSSQIEKEKLAYLYALASIFIDELYKQELANFEHEFSDSEKITNKTKCLISFIRGFIRFSHSDQEEKRILKKILDDLIPILYICEEILSKEEIEKILQFREKIDDETFLNFFIFIVVSTAKTIEQEGIKVVQLRTAELKNYSRSRLLLDETDQIFVEKKQKRLKEACFYRVGPYKVLCGFFTEDGSWISENHLDPQKLKAILLKYDLAARTKIE